MQFVDTLKTTPLVAILRGVTPETVLSVADVLYEAGFRIVEVPLNSPRPLESIARLAEAYAGRMLVGAGTVLSGAAVRDVQAAGGTLIVSPHFGPEVVGAALENGLEPLPGAMTPSEIFGAWRMGVKAVKLFPAELIQPHGVKALRSVLPKDLNVLPVGGITPENMGDFAKAGADGFGIGSALYKPGDTAEAVAPRAASFISAAKARPGA